MLRETDSVGEPLDIFALSKACWVSYKTIRDFSTNNTGMILTLPLYLICKSVNVDICPLEPGVFAAISVPGYCKYARDSSLKQHCMFAKIRCGQYS